MNQPDDVLGSAPINAKFRLPVLIVEDEVIFARALASIIEPTRETAMAHTAAEAREAFARGKFAAVIVDETLPDGSGLAWLEEVRAAGWQRPALVMTGRFEQAIANRAQALDAQCLFKPADESNVFVFLDGIERSERAVNERLDIAVNEVIRAHGLTRRQAQVLRFACAGAVRLDLPDSLGVASSTTKSHVRSLLKRLNEKSLEDVVHRVLRRVLQIQPPE